MGAPPVASIKRSSPAEQTEQTVIRKRNIRKNLITGTVPPEFGKAADFLPEYQWLSGDISP